MLFVTVALGICMCPLRLHAIAWLRLHGLGGGEPLACLELFAGGAAVTRAFRIKGFSAQPYDVERCSRTEDMLTVRGFLHAVRLTLRLQPGSLLYSGIPCSSWVGVSNSRGCLSVSSLMNTFPAGVHLACVTGCCCAGLHEPWYITSDTRDTWWR